MAAANNQPNPWLLFLLGRRIFPMSRRRTIANLGTLQRKFNLAVYTTVTRSVQYWDTHKVHSFKSEIVSTGLIRC